MSENIRYKRGSKPELDKKLLAYSAAAGAVLAAAPSAEAQVVYEEINPEQTVSNGTFSIDFDGDGQADLILRQFIWGGMDVLVSALPADGRGAIVGSGEYWGCGMINVLDYGDIIDANSPTFNRQDGVNCYWGEIVAAVDVSGGMYSYYGGGAGGKWAGVSDKYLGFKFEQNGGMHYGWVRLSVDSGATSFTVKAYGYQSTPDTAVPAGSMSPLPVELAAFDAKMTEAGARLTWQTASERNNAGFEILMQELRDGNEVADPSAYTTVGFVEGAGNSEQARDYSFRIPELMPGTYAFRLKQVDFDGSASFSPEVALQVEMASAHVLSPVYPNPFNPQSSFSFAVARTQHVRVEVYNMLGQLITSLHDGVMEGQQAMHFRLDGSQWPSGNYLVRVHGENFSEVRRATLVK